LYGFNLGGKKSNQAETFFKVWLAKSKKQKLLILYPGLTAGRCGAYLACSDFTQSLKNNVHNITEYFNPIAHLNSHNF
jgi:hypothetical protein